MDCGGQEGHTGVARRSDPVLSALGESFLEDLDVCLELLAAGTRVGGFRGQLLDL